MSRISVIGLESPRRRQTKSAPTLQGAVTARASAIVFAALAAAKVSRAAARPILSQLALRLWAAIRGRWRASGFVEMRLM